MSKHNQKVKPGLNIKKRHGHRAFTYQVPPEVADRLPPGVTVALHSFTREELLALARQAEPQVLLRLVDQPAKNPLEALLLLVEEIYGFLQGKRLPIPIRSGSSWPNCWQPRMTSRPAGPIAEHRCRPR
jgi:hypothetical protein